MVIPQAGGGLTFKTTSLVVKLLVHCPESCTVSRKTAVPGPFVRFTVIGKLVHAEPLHELVPTIWAGPETMLHVREVIGLSPDWADPFKVKVFVSPAVHFDSFVPAKAAGPMIKGTVICCGETKSTVAEESDWEFLVFTKIVLTPSVKHVLKLPRRAVKSTATSANVFTS